MILSRIFPRSLHPTARFAAQFFAACLVSATISIVAADGHDGWLTNVDEAMEQAKEEGKDVFIDFSGSDWCHWCDVLNKEVLSQEAFAAAKDKFVLVSLDFPQDQSKLTNAEKKHNALWRKKFEVPGFPAIFLLDESGRPYARTGYRKGGPQKYLEHLNELRGIRSKRDAAFASADGAQGGQRAKYLDQAIRTMEPAIAWRSYDGIIREIMKLDAADALGLKSQYGEGLQRRTIEKRLKSIMARSDPSKPSQAAAIGRKLQALAAEVQPTGQVRDDLLKITAQLLWQGGKKADAVEIAEQQLADPSIQSDSRLKWTVLKINGLASEKEFDAALELLETAKNSSAAVGPATGILTGLQAQILVGARREAEAIATLAAVLPTIENGELKQQLQRLYSGIQRRLEAKEKEAEAETQ